jgi:ABC-2 type transport system permease protein
MNALLRRLGPGGFAWLVVHELRLALRNSRRRARSLWIGLILLAIFVGVGIMAALGLRNVPIHGGPAVYTGVLAASILLMSFMTTQALLRSQHTLYESGDLDLLLSAPLEPRTILRAKLCGIAASVVISFALLVLPIAIPVAILGHPGLFGIPALLAALSLTGACLGLAIMVGIVALAGPRAARTLGQIIGALLAGGVFLISQLMSNGGGGRRSAALSLFSWLSAHRVGTGGIGALPGRAALGDPLAAALLLGGALLLFAATSHLFGRSFLASYQKARMRLSRRRAATGQVSSQFRAGLFAAMFAKEWRLLVRDPALAFQVVLRLIYLAPLALAAFGHGRGPPLLPALAFASVLIAGQLVGSFAWLAVSAEDAPDLLTVAPVARRQVERAKLASAMAMAAPFGLILPAAIALSSPLGALATIMFTAAGGATAGLIEIKWQKPAPRKTFQRRRSGSILAGILTLLATACFGGLAALAVYVIGSSGF